MKIKTGLFLAIVTVFSHAWAQQIMSDPPTELQPGYPGYPASNAPFTSPSTVQRPEAPPGGEASSDSRSSGGYPLPAQAGDSGVSVPPVEVRPLTDMPVKPLSPPAPMTSTAPVTENGVTYRCGGVGLDEADHMKREARNYDFMLTFAARNGSYLADVNVDIADANGKSLLKTTCGAPMMLVDLPKSGNYLIRAETAGYTVSRTVQISETRRDKEVTLIWPMQ